MAIMSTNFAKTLVWKHKDDIELRRYKARTPITIDHHMPLNEPPHENFLRTPGTEANIEFKHSHHTSAPWPTVLVTLL